ncbi:methyltransferase [Thermoclostridium stercorarium]|uniref:Methyltransferase n=1 Tax=Thermoclostridium stercorarium subsp. leptospartum DSM 9219 TaxID=1346611 RepID=A0A1B1YNT9_THEST|nr:methyltransferase [Thermoclostridium stercorarium]ANX02418.1 methyltransferase [Thermoclostridium stercorarium subsp. leptospartum DSM 9219]UZQ85500.1 methyltransferase [Thermoclostridium stercorarium]
MNEHYYTEKPTSEIKEKVFTETYRNKTLEFVSVSGVFAFDTRIDKASRFLIETFRPTGRTVLDMGCGYGAIGLFIKALYPQLIVTLTDINERAVAYAQKNAERNNLWVKVVRGNLYESVGDSRFDDIVTNPPITAGKKVVTQLIQEAVEHLEPGGALWLVAYHNKGGSTYKRIMEENFGNVEDVEKQGGIRVYRSYLK